MPTLYNVSIEPNDVNWAWLQADPTFQVFARLEDVNLEGRALDNSLTNARLESLIVRATATLDFTNTFELSLAPSLEYCTSPMSASGIPATLETFGSQVEDTSYLNVRASGLPDQSFAILFVGTSPVSQPLGNATLCVGGTVRRMGGVSLADLGVAEFPIDLKGRLAGDSIHLQSFFRDPVVGVAASNASAFIVAPRL